MAAAGLWTTPTDLAKFAIEMQLSLQGKSNKVLSQSMTVKMLTPFIEDFVALGFFIDTKGQAIYFQHGGADEGFRAQLMAHKTKGYGAVVMVNSDNGQIMNEILRAIAREYAWQDYLPQPYEIVKVEAKQLDHYVGRYLVNPDRILAITVDNGRLYATATQTPRAEFLPIAPDHFVRRDDETQYQFVSSSSGTVDTVRISFDGNRVAAARVPTQFNIPYETLQAGDLETAVAAYRKIQQQDPKNFVVSENRINNMGYELLGQKKYAAAIAIFRMNVEFYPDSWNTYDSLGEAYAGNGEKELAISCYKKSLALNPHNTNGAKMLQQLERDGSK